MSVQPQLTRCPTCEYPVVRAIGACSNTLVEYARVGATGRFMPDEKGIMMLEPYGPYELHWKVCRAAPA
jgi:hypothetical protein